MIGNGGELACDRSMMQMQTAVAVVAVVSLGHVRKTPTDKFESSIASGRLFTRSLSHSWTKK